MHTTVCLDERGQVLRPAILWADQRSQAQVRETTQRIGQAELARLTGNPLATGFMLATWLWLREHEPDLVRKTHTLLLPKDALRYFLTGSLGSEPSDASSTLLFDPLRRDWSGELLERLEIPQTLLPPVAESAAIAGVLNSTCAAVTGLLAGTPFVYGASDQAAQALGNGIVEPGLVSCTIGTGGQLFAPLNRPEPDPGLRVHLFCHALPGLWHLLAATLTAGLSLQWLRDQVFLGGEFDVLADAAAQVAPGSEGLLFAPYLAGERTPYMDPNLRAGFLGLTLRHGQPHLVRAVMEGVVLALREGLDRFHTLGVSVERLVASGGSAQHPLWVRLQADIFNQPVYRAPSGHEASALGAALLAGVGTGIFADARQACRQVVSWLPDPVQPVAENVEIYQGVYERFTKLAGLIQGI